MELNKITGRVASSDSESPFAEERVGPMRTTKSCRQARRTSKPYPQGCSGNPTGEQTHGADHVTLWPLNRCPRNGIQWIAASWESADTPAHSSKAHLLQFMTSLTNNLTEEDVVECGRVITSFLTCSSSTSAIALSSATADDIVSVVSRCVSASRNDAAASFVVMLSHIQLAAKCKRCVRPVLINLHVLHAVSQADGE